MGEVVLKGVFKIEGFKKGTIKTQNLLKRCIY